MNLVSIEELNELLGIIPEREAQLKAERELARAAARAKSVVFCIQRRGFPIIRVESAEDAWDYHDVQVRGISAGYTRESFIQYFERHVAWEAFVVKVWTEPIERTDENGT